MNWDQADTARIKPMMGGWRRYLAPWRSVLSRVDAATRKDPVLRLRTLRAMSADAEGEAMLPCVVAWSLSWFCIGAVMSHHALSSLIPWYSSWTMPSDAFGGIHVPILISSMAGMLTVRLANKAWIPLLESRKRKFTDAALPLLSCLSGPTGWPTLDAELQECKMIDAEEALLAGGMGVDDVRELGVLANILARSGEAALYRDLGRSPAKSVALIERACAILDEARICGSTWTVLEHTGVSLDGRLMLERSVAPVSN